MSDGLSLRGKQLQYQAMGMDAQAKAIGEIINRQIDQSFKSFGPASTANPPIEEQIKTLDESINKKIDQSFKLVF